MSVVKKPLKTGDMNLDIILSTMYESMLLLEKENKELKNRIEILEAV